jgi:phosphatidylserine/phosphatidylglycerophosphate/cardiolipin synthase-like enzyme
MMLKKRWPWVLLFLWALLGYNTAGFTQTPFPAAGTILVFFSPNGGATEAIVGEIEAAHKEIFVQAYSFSSQPIARALVAARKRGVTVEVIFDKNQWSEKYSAADFTHNAGIPTYIDDAHAIAHNKIMIIDRRVILTGSFNFTRAAEERNAENLLVIKGNAPLLEKYLANFEAHKSHSTLYNGR